MKEETLGLIGTGTGAAIGSIVGGALFADVTTGFVAAPAVASVVVLFSLLWGNRPWKEAHAND